MTQPAESSAAAGQEWEERAAAVARREAPLPAEWQVIEGRLPVLFDVEVFRAAGALLLAVAAWIAAFFLESVAQTSLDPFALALRLVALVTSVRFVLGAIALAPRAKIILRARTARLVLSPEGIAGVLPSEDFVLRRGEILSVAAHGAWHTRASARRSSVVYLVLSDPSRTHLTLPPIFEDNSGILTERLQRWLGRPAFPESPVFPPPAQLASKVYDDAARGVRDVGTTAVQHGWGWLRRGPWATPLLALAVMDAGLRGGLLRVETGAESSATAYMLLGALALACLVAAFVPLGWVFYTRRDIAARKGLAMVLTSGELLMRTRRGVLRVAWPQLGRVSVDTRVAVSLIEGAVHQRTLVLKRKDGSPIRYEEAFLGVPAEVALELIEGYRAGLGVLLEGDV